MFTDNVNSFEIIKSLDNINVNTFKSRHLNLCVYAQIKNSPPPSAALYFINLLTLTKYIFAYIRKINN